MKTYFQICFYVNLKNLVVSSTDCKIHNFHILHALSLPSPSFPVLSPIYWEIYLIKSLKNKGRDSAYLAYFYAKWEKYEKKYSNFTSFLWGPHKQKKNLPDKSHRKLCYIVISSSLCTNYFVEPQIYEIIQSESHAELSDTGIFVEFLHSIST